MSKLIPVLLTLVSATAIYAGYNSFSNTKEEQEKILRNTPQVSRVLSLEKELDTPEFRRQSPGKVLHVVFSDAQLEDKFRQVVTEYNQLSENPEIKSAVDDYKSNNNEVGCLGLVCGLGSIAFGVGVYGLTKRE